MAASLDRTVPLDVGEEVVLSGAARWLGGGLHRTAYVRLTVSRLSVLLHYGFKPDQVIDLPRAAIGRVFAGGATVEIAADMADGRPEILTLGNWVSRYPPMLTLIDCTALAAAVTK